MSQTLKGSEVNTAIKISDTKMPYRSDSKLAGQFYHLATWGTRNFTCSVEFYRDWRDGKIKELSIEESKYMRKDSTTGVETEVQSATLMGYMTWDKASNVLEFASNYRVKEAKADITVQHARVAAIAELGLTTKDLEMLKELV